MDWMTPVIGLAGAGLGAIATYLAPWNAERLKRKTDRERAAQDQERAEQEDLKEAVDSALAAAAETRQASATWIRDLDAFVNGLTMGIPMDAEEVDERMKEDEHLFRTAIGMVLRSVGLYIGSAAVSNQHASRQSPDKGIALDSSEWAPADTRNRAFLEEARKAAQEVRAAVAAQATTTSPGKTKTPDELFELLEELSETRRSLDFTILAAIMRKWGYVVERA
jgi:hypothetical protein